MFLFCFGLFILIMLRLSYIKNTLKSYSQILCYSKMYRAFILLMFLVAYLILGNGEAISEGLKPIRYIIIFSVVLFSIFDFLQGFLQLRKQPKPISFFVEKLIIKKIDSDGFASDYKKNKPSFMSSKLLYFLKIQDYKKPFQISKSEKAVLEDILNIKDFDNINKTIKLNYYDIIKNVEVSEELLYM